VPDCFQSLSDNELMRRTVLIVEDVDTCASTLEIVFSGIAGLHVVIAASGEQACRLLDNGMPGLAAIVTDLEMRGMDGFELIERVRGHAAHRGIPIMVITGSSDPDAPAQSRKLGADAFFLKPYSPALVREKMEELLNHEIPTS
jgi:two-component system chemotaxis response regulator CheY